MEDNIDIFIAPQPCYNFAAIVFKEPLTRTIEHVDEYTGNRQTCQLLLHRLRFHVKNIC